MFGVGCNSSFADLWRGATSRSPVLHPDCARDGRRGRIDPAVGGPWNRVLLGLSSPWEHVGSCAGRGHSRLNTSHGGGGRGSSLRTSLRPSSCCCPRRDRAGGVDWRGLAFTLLRRRPSSDHASRGHRSSRVLSVSRNASKELFLWWCPITSGRVGRTELFGLVPGSVPWGFRFHHQQSHEPPGRCRRFSFRERSRWLFFVSSGCS